MAIISAPRKIEFIEKSLPPLGEKDVLLQVKSAAICGSDLHIFKGRHPFAPLPMAIGHELSGQIIAVGGEVCRVKLGERVTVEPVLACGHCEYCRRGRYHLCLNISFQYRRGQGGFTPYFIAPEDRVFRLPERVTYEEGALIEPLSVALHAVKNSGVQPGQSTAVFGAGAIGLLVMMLSHRTTGGYTFITDVQEARLNKALELENIRAINSREEDPLQIILEETGGLGVDQAFEAVGLEATLTQALHALKKGGHATLLGIFENPEAKIPANLFIQREISLRGSQGYNWDFEDGLSLLERGYLPLKALITHHFPFEQLQDGFELLLSPQNKAIKVIIDIN
jgi:2-desacetyl-2-hydroxyethyl bacteriochlorophyllide A dehydrogenase